MRLAVWVTHRFAAFHCWRGAPDHRAYLATPHRHLFHVRAGVDVGHGDRDVEFHDLLDAVRASCSRLGKPYLPPSGDAGQAESAVYLGGMSCEDIASVILADLVIRWPGRSYSCEVSEDGEAGAALLLP